MSKKSAGSGDASGNSSLPSGPHREEGAEAGSSPLALEVQAFTKVMDGLFTAYPLVNVVLFGVFRAADKRLQRFTKANGVLTESKGSKTTYLIPQEVADEGLAMLHKRDRLGAAAVVVSRSSLIVMVSQFDAFLARFLRQVFKARPELLDLSEKPLTFSELEGLGDVASARAYLVDRELDSVMRGSLFEKVKWMEKRFSVDLGIKHNLWKVIVECTERRNLLTHTDGVVSHQYLRVCGEHAVELPERVCLGAQLRVGPKYFEEAQEALLVYGILVSQSIWRKTLPSMIAEADESLSDTTYTLIRDGRYGVAVRLLEFALESNKRTSSERYRRMFAINLAQAKKWQGDEGGCRAVLDSLDWTACSEDFKVCVAVLRDDYDEAIVLMRAGGAKGPIGAEGYKAWPVFRKLRLRDDFRQAFRDVFGEVLEEVRVENVERASGAAGISEALAAVDPAFKEWMTELRDALPRTGVSEPEGSGAPRSVKGSVRTSRSDGKALPKTTLPERSKRAADRRKRN